MPKVKLTKKETQQIESAVAFFESKKEWFETHATALREHLAGNAELSPFIHFIKHRVKTSESLRMKLQKKACEKKSAGQKPDIDQGNLFTEITDLAGVRILHLHTEQMQKMHAIIRSIFDEQQYILLKSPEAKCWDVEYEDIFKSFGIETTTTKTMYTSVHYIVKARKEIDIAVELQVRTLMEEVWGEVSHRVNYPVESTVESCRDQLKVLARLTSGCTRLVDSIFKSSGGNDRSS